MPPRRVTFAGGVGGDEQPRMVTLLPRKDVPVMWRLTDVTLVVEGDDLDPESVTELLDASPSRLPDWSEKPHERGEVGFWGLEFDIGFSPEFPCQLNAVLDFAEERADRLRELQAEGRHVCVSVRGHAGNESELRLTSAAVSRLAELGFPVRVTPNLNQR